MTIGDKILNLRKARGWSQEELADRIGVTRQAVSRWESGSTKPDADKLVDLCDLFGVSADYLLREKYDAKGNTSVVEIPAQMMDTGRPFTAVQRLGILLIILSILLLFVLGVLNSFNPCRVTIDDRTYTGFAAFIMFHDLGWLILLDVMLLCLGFWLMLKKESAESREGWMEYWKTCWHDCKELFRNLFGIER